MQTADSTTLHAPIRETIPPELQARQQWVTWRSELREGKLTKIPYCAKDRRARSTDPKTWLPFEDAWSLYESARFDGIGYVFGEDDPYAGIDLDAALPESERQRIITRCNSYTEQSPSGLGHHILVRGKLPSSGRKKGPLEIYDQGRYFTMTGHIIEGASMVIEERQEVIDWLLHTYFNDPEPETRSESVDSPNLSDRELLDKAFAAANGGRFARLWYGDLAGYPSPSEADLALASMLAFWTGPDPARLERLMRTSKLLREKWDEKHYGNGQSYLERVIEKALVGRTEFFKPGRNGHTGGAEAEREIDDTQRPIPSVPESSWPVLDAAGLQGLAGEIVRAIDPHTEADPVAVLAQLLAFFGCAIGREAHFKVEHTQHSAKLFEALVGATSKGRKGMSSSTLKHLFVKADPDFVNGRIKGGLSSGEGLIYQVRDAAYETQKDKKTGQEQEVIIDKGEEDKRLVILEPELAQALKIMVREGNILSPIMRQAWDDEKLTPLTKHNRMTATGSHVSIIGHITRDELLRHLGETEMANGFVNRFIFLVVKRSKCLPNPKGLPAEQIEELAKQLRERIEQAGLRAQAGPIERDEEAEALWCAVYPDLSEGKPGLMGAILGRAEAQVMRLALAYALLDGAASIRLEHLQAALALWDYSEASVRLIFGEATGDGIADRILEELKKQGAMSETDIYSDLFQRNVKAGRIHRALETLQRSRFIKSVVEETGGRKKTVWRATHKTHKTHKEGLRKGLMR